MAAAIYGEKTSDQRREPLEEGLLLFRLTNGPGQPEEFGWPGLRRIERLARERSLSPVRCCAPFRRTR